MPEPVPLFGAVKPIELQVRFPSTVRVKPCPIIMSSPGSGRMPDGHGAPGTVELQLPLPVVVIVAENVFVQIVENKNMNRTKNSLVKGIVNKALFFIFYFSG